MSWSELERLVAEAENDRELRRALRNCRSKQELVLSARRLGYRITRMDIQRAREEGPNKEVENRTIRTSALEG
jgi:predicted ribosomally synthesized peptide with nif11-like leader